MFAYSNGFWGVYKRFQADFLVGRGVENSGLCGGYFPWRNLSWGKKISIKGAQRFLALFEKNNEKINMQKFFN